MPELRVTQLDPNSEIIDFGIGQPAFELLPLALLRDAAASQLGRGDRTFLNYGYEQGEEPLRELLAAFLRREAGYDVTAERLMVTSGASQGLDMVCTHFARPGDVVFVEEPTYFLALRVFADRRLRVVPLATSSQGLELTALSARLDHERPAFVYTVPTFQNPSGTTMPTAQRTQLAQMAEQYDFYVVADEVYHLLNYDGAPPAPLANHTGSERVISLGSFSKILAPGLRLGWIQAAPTLLRRLTGSGLLDSGGGLNPFTSAIVRALLEEDRLAPHIAHLKSVYARRAACMDAALQRYLGNMVRYTKPKGGFFFWVKLAEDVDTRAMLPAARERGVGYQPGAKFSADGGCQSCMRLSFTFFEEPQIEEGIRRLRTLLA